MGLKWIRQGLELDKGTAQMVEGFVKNYHNNLTDEENTVEYKLAA